jgi:hypothetical protein
MRETHRDLFAPARGAFESRRFLPSPVETPAINLDKGSPGIGFIAFSQTFARNCARLKFLILLIVARTRRTSTFV